MTKHKVHEAKNALNFIAQLYSERGQGRAGKKEDEKKACQMEMVKTRKGAKYAGRACSSIDKHASLKI